MRLKQRVVVIIPALNEAAALPGVLTSIPDWVDRVIVADNNSTDATAAVSAHHGAQVVRAPRRGYGWACVAGIHAAADADILVFLDGDGSDFPQAMHSLVDPIAAQRADFVLGSRRLGISQAGALNPAQRWGNRLACRLIRWRWRHAYTDLGPFRAIRRAALVDLHMTQMTFGWTVEMQIAALRTGLRVLEVPVNYRQSLGRSKVSGTLRGVFCAGYHILRVITLESTRRRTRH